MPPLSDMADPIDVQITDETEAHCLKIVLQARNAEQPLEIFLHTTQAIDLVHKLSLTICELHHRDSGEILKHKYGVNPPGMPPLKNFERLIEERDENTLTLACGHTMPGPKPPIEGLDYAVCETCVEAYRCKLEELSSDGREPSPASASSRRTDSGQRPVCAEQKQQAEPLPSVPPV